MNWFPCDPKPYTLGKGLLKPHTLVPEQVLAELAAIKALAPAPPRESASLGSQRRSGAPGGANPFANPETPRRGPPPQQPAGAQLPPRFSGGGEGGGGEGTPSAGMSPATSLGAPGQAQQQAGGEEAASSQLSSREPLLGASPTGSVELVRQQHPQQPIQAQPPTIRE